MTHLFVIRERRGSRSPFGKPELWTLFIARDDYGRGLVEAREHIETSKLPASISAMQDVVTALGGDPKPIIIERGKR